MCVPVWLPKASNAAWRAEGLRLVEANCQFDAEMSRRHAEQMAAAQKVMHDRRDVLRDLPDDPNVQDAEWREVEPLAVEHKV